MENDTLGFHRPSSRDLNNHRADKYAETGPQEANWETQISKYQNLQVFDEKESVAPGLAQVVVSYE